MNTVTLNFRADDQQLVLTGSERFAANTVGYVRAAFDLGDGWDGFDSVRAVWATDFAKIATVLDSDGACAVPWEVLKRVDTVMVNLVGSISDGEELTDRLTTYKVKALDVNGCTNIDGSETAEITPSQFEQFVAIVKEEVGKVKDISDVKLNADYTLTFLFSDGTEWTTPIPIRGEQGAKGDTGNGISDIEKIGSQGLTDTYRIAYTNGGHYDFTVTNGAKGEQGETGNGIESITLTATSGAVKTYTIAFTDGTSTTFDVTDGEVTNEVLDGATIVQTNTDKVPYLFRQSGGGVKVGLKESDKIVGGTVAWNQRCQNGDFSNGTTGWTSTGGELTADNNVGSFIASQFLGFANKTNLSVVSGHKYITLADVKISSGVVEMNCAWASKRNTKTGVFETIGAVWQSEYTGSSLSYPRFYDRRESNWDAVLIKNVRVHDLTQMFGSTIADYIYSLEQANAGAGVAWFKKLFPKPYYEYNAGELISVEGLESHDTVGFNQWDEESASGYWDIDNNGVFVTSGNWTASKSHIPCLPSTTYYMNASSVPTSSKGRILFYDADKNMVGYIGGLIGTFTTPSNAHYMTFYMSNAYFDYDICINLSWSGTRNGEYEPYEKHSYPLDNSLTLRGIPKLDSSNNLYYDGDEYASDGSVTRKYGVRAYQSGDESLTDAITDKTNTVYKLATPTTETAEPYTNPQTVDPSGTEEYVTTRIVPVGHETEYPLTLIDTMPTANGTYTMSITVTNGKRTVNWA